MAITPGLLIAPKRLRKMLFLTTEGSVPVREVLVRMTNLGWLVVNTVTKVEMWRAAETIGHLLSTLIKLERTLELAEVQTLWVFKVSLHHFHIQLTLLCGFTSFSNVASSSIGPFNACIRDIWKSFGNSCPDFYYFS